MAMRSIAAALVLSPLLATPACAQQPSPAPAAATDLHAPLDGLLRAHLRNERVDYLALRDEHFADLRGYLDALATLDAKAVAAMAKDDRLALLINLYNATVLAAVCERYVDGWSASVDKFALFDEKIVRLAGETFSLNQLENDRIRKVFAEPRIHVALVCAARSCPPLQLRAYRGADLDATLTANARMFVMDTARNRIPEALGAKVELSKIFEWYKADFGGDDAGVLKWVGRYGACDLSGRKIAWLDYSWEPNLLAPTGPGWIVVIKARKDGAVSLRKGEVVQVTQKAQDAEVYEVRAPFGKGTASVDVADTKPYAPPGNQ